MSMHTKETLNDIENLCLYMHQLYILWMLSQWICEYSDTSMPTTRSGNNNQKGNVGGGEIWSGIATRAQPEHQKSNFGQKPNCAFEHFLIRNYWKTLMFIAFHCFKRKSITNNIVFEVNPANRWTIIDLYTLFWKGGAVAAATGLPFSQML